ncbi:hypothetical protein GIB67_006887 [Kingdonia uniflora]|uniref:Uncharacterized protein n=1 Tax=Kingdonia uniflora TaxID=39325 RepID=A0A7J7L047_9MAGN|nr:hypothetical protein GIB67_006887 [Kingdonia uniflora]
MPQTLNFFNNLPKYSMITVSSDLLRGMFSFTARNTQMFCPSAVITKGIKLAVLYRTIIWD